MPVQWHEENLKRLLLAILAVNKVDSGAVAKSWLDLYSSETFEHPSKRAIEQQILKLKKSVGTGTAKTSSGASSAKAKLADDRKTPSASMATRDRDDSEVIHLPVKTRSPSVVTAKHESVAPTASTSATAEGSSVIKVEDDVHGNDEGVVIDDDSDSATEGRFETPLQTRNEADNGSMPPPRSRGIHQARYESVAGSEMPPPARNRATLSGGRGESVRPEQQGLSASAGRDPEAHSFHEQLQNAARKGHLPAGSSVGKRGPSPVAGPSTVKRRSGDTGHNGRAGGSANAGSQV